MAKPDQSHFFLRATVATVVMLTFSFVLSAIAPANAAQQCAIEHARYETMDNSHWTAGFRQIPKASNWLTNVAFYVQSGETKRTYWFLFDAGSARYINMLPTVDVTQPGWHPRDSDAKEPTPLNSDMHYLPVDAQLGLSLTMPQAGKVAPDFILLPDLQEIMWYRMTNPTQRESAPLAFFKLSGCNSN